MFSSPDFPSPFEPQSTQRNKEVLTTDYTDYTDFIFNFSMISVTSVAENKQKLDLERAIMKRTKYNTGRGFTVLEILIVLAILGFVCWTVIPEATRGAGAGEYKEAELESTLTMLRAKLDLYKAEHLDQYPCGDPANPAAPEAFVKRMVTVTNADHSPRGIFGPYMNGFPVNVFNGLNDVRYGADPGKNLAGWCFDPATGRIAADDNLASADGTPHSRY